MRSTGFTITESHLFSPIIPDLSTDHIYHINSNCISWFRARTKLINRKLHLFPRLLIITFILLIDYA